VCFYVNFGDCTFFHVWWKLKRQLEELKTLNIFDVLLCNQSNINCIFVASTRKGNNLIFSRKAIEVFSLPKMLFRAKQTVLTKNKSTMLYSSACYAKINKTNSKSDQIYFKSEWTGEWELNCIQVQGWSLVVGGEVKYIRNAFMHLHIGMSLCAKF
jgi:hypothetical protein